jgi:hypothetical protein
MKKTQKSLFTTRPSLDGLFIHTYTYIHTHTDTYSVSQCNWQQMHAPITCTVKRIKGKEVAGSKKTEHTVPDAAMWNTGFLKMQIVLLNIFSH